MKKMYRLLVFTLFLVLSLAAQAQTGGRLTGNLKDENGQALGFGTVALLQANSATIVTGGVTDGDGKFAIPTPAAGSYRLRITAIGFAALETPPFEVKDKDFSKDFGPLTLKQDAKALNEVQVQALRPTVRVEADKMVVSVDGTALAAGNTAYEVLAKSPGVFIDQDGNIQLNGKAGVRIMIDGKLTYLSGKELQTLLQGMSAENLKDLEIITNPSAKYDAEGTAGIININLKKNELGGVNGSVYAGHQYNGLHGYSGGANINYKKGPWNTFATADVSRRTHMRDNTMNRLFKGETETVTYDQVGHEEGRRSTSSLRLGADYDLNKKHSVGVMTNLMFFKADNDYLTESFLRNGKALQDTLISARNIIEGHFVNTTFNAHYLGKLDTLGTTLSADLDYVTLNDERDSYFNNRYTPVNSSEAPRQDALYSKNLPSYTIYSAKVDFVKPLNPKTKLEAGAKASHVTSDNSLNFFKRNNGTQTPDPTRSNQFIYKENILAAYTNFSTSLGEKWSVQAGLRAEQTLGEGHLVTKDSTNTRKYLNFFPSVFFSQKVNKDYQVTYNYSRRINRPRYDALNPFIFYLDPYTWASGNPYLRPQYTNSFQVTQTIKSTYNLTLSYAVTNDFIAEIPVQDVVNNTTTFGQRNVDQFKELNLTVVAPIKIAKFWDISNNLTAAHQDYSIVINEKPLRNEQFFFYAQSTSNIQLPKKVRAELNLGYQGPLAYGLYKISGNWGVDVGFKRNFLNDKLEASVNATDLFRTRRIIGKANFDGNRNEFDQYFAQQSLRLNLRYRFNKGEKFEAKKRNTNLEELNRAGGN
ncbi:MAG: outer membrane beta-barrel protein [Adhaeribacter sp.]